MRTVAAFGAAIAIILLFGGAVSADIFNGDFHAGLAGWNAAVDVDPDHPDYGAAEVVGGQLHLLAVNHYLWDGDLEDWVRQESRLTWLEVDQTCTAPGSGDALSFDISLTVDGAPDSFEEAAEAYLRVTVFYNNDTAFASKTFASTASHTGYVLPTPGLIAGSTVRIILDGQSGLDTGSAEYEQDYDITVEGYLDNFQFVPEPASALLLVCSGAFLARRRK